MDLAPQLPDTPDAPPAVDTPGAPAARQASPLRAVFREAREALADTVALDLRSLAVLRLGLAVLAMVEVAGHAAGAASAWLAAAPGAGTAHQLATTLPLLAAGAVAAALLLAGFRSRLSALVTWLALLGLGAPAAADPGAAGVCVRLLLLCAVCLPIDARFSIDAALRDAPERPSRLVSVAGAALAGQVVVLELYGRWLLGALAADLPGGAAVPPLTLSGWLVQDQPWTPPALVQAADWATIAACALLVCPAFAGASRTLAVAIGVVVQVYLQTHRQDTLLPTVLALAWLSLTPPAAWNALFAELRTPRRTGITLWYGRDCPLRLRLLRTFLLLPEARLRSTHENLELDVFRRQRRSWIVTDHHGYRYLRFSAFAEVCRASPLLFWLAPLLRTGLVESVGDGLFDIGQRYDALLHRAGRRLASALGRPHRPAWPESAATAALVCVLLAELAYALGPWREATGPDPLVRLLSMLLGL